MRGPAPVRHPTTGPSRPGSRRLLQRSEPAARSRCQGQRNRNDDGRRCYQRYRERNQRTARSRARWALRRGSRLRASVFGGRRAGDVFPRGPRASRLGVGTEWRDRRIIDRLLVAGLAAIDPIADLCPVHRVCLASVLHWLTIQR